MAVIRAATAIALLGPPTPLMAAYCGREEEILAKYGVETLEEMKQDIPDACALVLLRHYDGKYEEKASSPASPEALKRWAGLARELIDLDDRDYPEALYYDLLFGGEQSESDLAELALANPDFHQLLLSRRKGEKTTKVQTSEQSVSQAQGVAVAKPTVCSGASDTQKATPRDIAGVCGPRTAQDEGAQAMAHRIDHTPKIDEGILAPRVERYTFIVRTEPSDAVVKNMSIVPKHRNGMRLAKGTYRVRVEAPGYKSVEKSIVVGGGDTDVTIRLTHNGDPSSEVGSGASQQGAWERRWDEVF